MQYYPINRESVTTAYGSEYDCVHNRSGHFRWQRFSWVNQRIIFNVKKSRVSECVHACVSVCLLQASWKEGTVTKHFSSEVINCEFADDGALAVSV